MLFCMSKDFKEAISLVFRDLDKVLVLKRSPNKDSFPNAWSIPSTYIRPGENVSQVANRLVKTKLGLEQVTLNKVPLGVSPLVDRGEYDLKMTDYVVEGYEGNINFNTEEYTEEYTEMRWVTPIKLLDLINKENGGQMGECTRTLLISENLL